MAGCVDIFTSRRTAFEKCKWWSQKNYTNKNTGRSSYELFCHKNAPSGEFWAEEIEGIAETMSASGDVRYTRYTVTISTNDDVQNKIHKNDFVEWNRLATACPFGKKSREKIFRRVYHTG